MARMYTSTGPVANQSLRAEPLFYHALATQLSEEFVVIHRLPLDTAMIVQREEKLASILSEQVGSVFIPLSLVCSAFNFGTLS